MTTKRCKGCRRVKSLRLFYRCCSMKDGYQSYCKTCSNKRAGVGTEVWSQKRREHYRSNWSQRAVYRAKIRAEERGVAFDLIADDIAVPKRCPVFDIETDGQW